MRLGVPGHQALQSQLVPGHGQRDHPGVSMAWGCSSQEHYSPSKDVLIPQTSITFCILFFLLIKLPNLLALLPGDRCLSTQMRGSIKRPEEVRIMVWWSSVTKRAFCKGYFASGLLETQGEQKCLWKQLLSDLFNAAQCSVSTLSTKKILCATIWKLSIKWVIVNWLPFENR